MSSGRIEHVWLCYAEFGWVYQESCTWSRFQGLFSYPYSHPHSLSCALPTLPLWYANIPVWSSVFIEMIWHFSTNCFQTPFCSAFKFCFEVSFHRLFWGHCSVTEGNQLQIRTQACKVTYVHVHMILLFLLFVGSLAQASLTSLWAWATRCGSICSLTTALVHLDSKLFIKVNLQLN